MVAAVSGRVLGWIVRCATCFNVVCNACGCLGVVAEESADEWRCRVVDGNDAEWIAIEKATVNEMHCDRKSGVCNKLGIDVEILDHY